MPFVPSQARTAAATLGVAVVLTAGCGGSASHGRGEAATPRVSTSTQALPVSGSQSPSATIPLIPNRDLAYTAGSYQLDVGPGLRLTLPNGWTGINNPPQEVGITEPGNSDAKLFFFGDLSAARSTGSDHGSPLSNVGRSPASLTKWIIGDRDFAVVSKPVPATIGHGIRTTTLTFGVSPASGPYGPGCKCVDIFTAPYFGDPFGIGGKEQVQVYLGPVVATAPTHTLIVVLDAPNHAELLHLDAAAKPILASVRLDAGWTAG